MPAENANDLPLRAKLLLAAMPLLLLGGVDLLLGLWGVNDAYRATHPTPLAREDAALMFRNRERLDTTVTPLAPLRLDRSMPIAPMAPFRVVTNGRGYRHPGDLGAKSAGTTRVLCIGDSYTFGYGVDLEDAYSARLARALSERHQGRAFEVVNVAQPGHSSAQGLRLWESELAALEPDLVTVSYGANDYGVGIVGYGDAARKLAQGTHPLQRMRVALLRSELFTLLLRGREALVKRIVKARKFQLPPPEEVRGDPAGCGRNVEEIARQAIARGARVVVVTQARAPGDHNEPAYRAALVAAAARSGAALADVAGAMDREMAALPAPPGGWELCPNRFFIDPTHLTAAGHEVAAREVAARVEELLAD